MKRFSALNSRLSSAQSNTQRRRRPVSNNSRSCTIIRMPYLLAKLRLSSIKNIFTFCVQCGRWMCYVNMIYPMWDVGCGMQCTKFTQWFRYLSLVSFFNYFLMGFGSCLMPHVSCSLRLVSINSEYKSIIVYYVLCVHRSIVEKSSTV